MCITTWVLLDALRILPVGLVQGPLRAQPQVSQQTTDGTFAELDTALALEHGANDVQGPQAKLELMVQRATQGHSLVKPLKIGSRNLPRPSSSRAFLQTIPTTTAIARQPPKYRSQRNVVNARHHRHWLTANDDRLYHFFTLGTARF